MDFYPQLPINRRLSENRTNSQKYNQKHHKIHNTQCCKYHPQKDATIRCRDCGAKICIECASVFSGDKTFGGLKTVCPECNVRNLKSEYGVARVFMMVAISMLIFFIIVGKVSSEILLIYGFILFPLLLLGNYVNGSEKIRVAQKKKYHALKSKVKKLENIPVNIKSITLKDGRKMDYCSNCDHEINKEDSYCYNCGSSLSSSRINI